jgi:predicted acetyltransferase
MAFHGDPAAALGFQQLRHEISTRGRPVGRVGYSIVLYDLREKSPP